MASQVTSFRYEVPAGILLSTYTLNTATQQLFHTFDQSHMSFWAKFQRIQFSMDAIFRFVGFAWIAHRDQDVTGDIPR